MDLPMLLLIADNGIGISTTKPVCNYRCRSVPFNHRWLSVLIQPLEQLPIKQMIYDGDKPDKRSRAMGGAVSILNICNKFG